MNTMTAYFYITFSLLLFPLLGKFLLTKTLDFPKLRKPIILMLCLTTLVTLISIETHFATISENVNWLFVTLMYLTLAVLLWWMESASGMVVKKIGVISRYVIFGIGYFIAVFGFFFILMASEELEPDQTIWLDKNLIYIERNIGQGPDPSERLKKIELYKTVPYLPFVMYRFKTRTYDEWSFPLQQQLTVSYVKQKGIIFLESFVKGYKDFSFTDRIKLN